MPRPILATIDTGAMANNLQLVRKRMQAEENSGSQISIWAVIKARGYGHGLKPAVKAFAKADGLAMLDFDEAEFCRKAGWSKPILLLEGFFKQADLEIISRLDLTTTVHSYHQLKILADAEVSKPINIFLKLNSGMHRLGFQPYEYTEAYQQALVLQAAGKVGTIGKMTHFAKADEDAVQTQEQLGLFCATTSIVDGPVSVCNSAATLTPGLAGSLAAAQQWVRPGICLYGSSPFASQSAASIGLQSAMTLTSEVISIHTLSTGESIGYGHTFTATKDMQVGIVACGYADGYPRHAVSGTPISIDGIKTRLVGRISMDMLAVDLDPVIGAKVGSKATLWGKDGPSIDEVAQSCGTIGYELMCALSARVPQRII